MKNRNEILFKNITDKGYKSIIILTVISLIYNLIRFDFDYIKSIGATITIFIFATFISYLYFTFLSLHKTTQFFYWWWRFYGIMIGLGVLANIIFTK